MVGPTASGKSAVAMTLAADGVEIVSVDSMQVYRGMDIGTAKPSPAERHRVPHHMIDIVDPSDSFSVAEFQEQGRVALGAIAGSALVVGGSGLHLRALIDPLEFPPTDSEVRAALEGLDLAGLGARLLAADPDAATVVDMANKRRVQRAVEIWELTGQTPTQRALSASAVAVESYESIDPVAIVGVDPGAELEARIESRVDEMLATGWLEEVAALGDRLGPTASGAVGYKELAAVVKGERNLAEGRTAIVQATRALAKRQRTYFRKDPRIRWLPWRSSLSDRVADAATALKEAKWNS
ncbi:MAG: tRNA (adenosine(37)-N6)-dimethylallyltransferase MiaA [Acidimicrobiia bacterium]|nr:tRNA (adenosine(37)-N6)-dimethylallyltransferase MiaA [Acidimicrobiia bacterium]